MKPYGRLKEGDIVYKLEFDEKNIGHIFHLPIRNVREYDEHKIYFEVYDSYIWNHRSCVMEKNSRWGVYSPSIEGLQMYWKREIKRICKKYKNTHNE